MKLCTVLTSCIFLCVREHLVAGLCSLGSNECIDIPRYNGRQYATCLTDRYIKEFSNNAHQCEDRTAVKCYYQCMLEVHDKNDGTVTPDCSCDQLSTSATPTDDLPAECYSPSGDDCNWYINCMEKRYPCRNGPASYAVDFAQRFCLMYSRHYNSFSTAGQSWVDAVRKCLQVKLVPSLRPGQHRTCAELRDFAFDTHTGCYLSPDEGRDSVCDLGISDFLQILWTLNEGFYEAGISAAIKALRPTFTQMVEVGSACIVDWATDAALSVCDLITTTTNAIWNNSRNKRSVPNENDPNFDIVYTVTNQISTSMKWTEKGLMWFGYPASVVENENGTDQIEITVRILLAAKATYDLNAGNISVANVSAAVVELSDAIEQGDLKFDLGESSSAGLFKVCSDINCTNSTFEAVPQNAERSDESGEEDDNLVRNIFIGVGVGLVVCIIIGVIIYFTRRGRSSIV